MDAKVKLKRNNFVPSGYPPEFNVEFRKYIRERDGHQCSICGTNKQILDVHHIDYIKKNTTKLNCVTLCRDCHTMIHFSCTWAGRVIWKYQLWELVGMREMQRGKECISKT